MKDACDGHWYVMAADGTFTLCADRKDARESAKVYDEDYPLQASHRAVRVAIVRQKRKAKRA